MEALPVVFSSRDGVRCGEALEHDLHGRLMFERDGVYHVAEFMVRAPLLRRVRPHVAHGTPEAQRAIANCELRRRQAARGEIAEDIGPALARLADATLDGEDHRRPVREGSGQHQERGVRLLEPGLNVDPVGPHVPRLERGQVPRAPLGLGQAVPLLARSGVPSPSSPRHVKMKSPLERPYRYRSGNSFATCGVRR